MTTSEKLLTTEEVAEILNVTIQTIYRWCRTSRIPHYYLNKNYRFRLKEIEGWLQANHVATDAGKARDAVPV